MKTGKVVRTLSLLLAMLMLAGMIPAAFATENTGNEIQEAAAGEQPVAESASGEEEETSESEDRSVIVYRAFDVSLQKDGQEVAAEGEFRVTVETGLDAGSLIPEDAECVGTGCRLYHVHEGKADIVEDAEMDDDGILTFTTPNFSTFLLEYKVKYKTITRDFITASGETYTITVTYEDNALIPDDAELYVAEITEDDEAYRSYYEQVMGVPADSTEYEFARFFDIEIRVDGKKIQPDMPVSVSIALKDAPAEAELKVVHFEADGPKDVKTEKAEATRSGETALSFSAASFSVYGVIVEPGPSGVNDLDRYSVKISNGGWYLGSGNVDENPRGISKTQDPSEAAVYTFESTGSDGYYNIYTMVNGEKQYINITAYSGNEGNAFLSSAPQALNVSLNGNNYVIQRQDNGNTYQINHWGSGNANRFAAYAYYQSADAQLTFTFTPPTIENNGEYAVIIKLNGSYYSVQNDGSLMPAQYSVEDNVAYVTMANPVFWTYVQENGNWNLRIPTQAATFDYQDLPNNYYYRYIDPNVDSGISDEPNVSTNPQYPTPKINEPGYNDVVNALDRQHRDYVQNCAIHSYEGNVIHGQTNYIGVDQATMKIKGNVSQDEAATVYFARVERVPPSSNLNNTVNHIDISIEGGASLSVPLAYGTYYYYADGEWRTLTVNSDTTLKLKVEHVPVTPEDMKAAEITAYSNRSGILNDAFYVTGYTQNHTNEITHSAQIRLEGSFKVADLEHTYSDYKLESGQWVSLTSQEQATRSEDTLTNEELQARKDNRVYYTVTVKKELEFPWVYEYAEGQTAQLYDADHHPLSTTRMVNLSKSFDYWEQGSGAPDWEGANECPPVTWYRTRWNSGHIIEDSSDHAGSGMDFRLTANIDDQSADVVALEITKYLRKNTANGEALHPSSTTPITNQFIIYEKVPSNQNDWNSVIDVGIGQGNNSPDLSDYSGIHGKSITVGSSGEGMVYDYDLGIDGENVKAGMYYIKEDENSIPKTILDENGNRWMYISTKVETEYVWRDYGDENKPRHSSDGVTSIPEVAGIYGTYHNTATGTDEELFNGFLEFYVYNIYERKYPVYIKKVDANSNAGLAGAEFDLYGPYTQQETAASGFDAKQNDKKLNSSSIVSETGIVGLGDLSDGIYYLYETKAPDGYLILTEPLEITVNSANEGSDPGAVSVKNPETYEVTRVVPDPETQQEPYYEITIPNTPGIVLPETGGKGTTVFCLLGGGLILAAGLMMVRRKKNIA